MDQEQTELIGRALIEEIETVFADVEEFSERRSNREVSEIETPEEEVTETEATDKEAQIEATEEVAEVEPEVEVTEAATEDPQEEAEVEEAIDEELEALKALEEKKTPKVAKKRKTRKKPPAEAKKETAPKGVSKDEEVSSEKLEADATALKEEVIREAMLRIKPQLKAVQTTVDKRLKRNRTGELNRVKRAAAALNFSETLYKEGLITEAAIPQDDLVYFLMSLEDVKAPDAENFSENYGGDSMAFFFKKLLTALLPYATKQVSLGTEVAPESSYQPAKKKPMTDYDYSVAMPYGYSMNSNSMDLHQKAIDYCKSNSLDYRNSDDYGLALSQIVM